MLLVRGRGHYNPSTSEKLSGNSRTKIKYPTHVIRKCSPSDDITVVHLLLYSQTCTKCSLGNHEK